MKKVAVIFLLCLNIFSTFAQIKNVKIIYGIVLAEDKGILSSEGKSNYEAAMKDAGSLQFILLYNQESTLFKIGQSMDNSNYGQSYARVFSGYSSDVYIDNNAKKLYKSFDDVLGKYTVAEDLADYKWTLTKEQKIINGFTCYKATGTETIINPAGTFIVPLVAWYAPKIPVSTGPLGTGGLPGLILEYQRKSTVYGAKEILINVDNLDIPKPELKNVKTPEQVKAMREAFLNDRN